MIYDLLFKVSAETMLTIAALSPPPTASIFPIEQVSPTRLVSWSDLPENNLPLGVNCFRRVDLWDDTGDSIVERVAGVDDFEVAEATYRAEALKGDSRSSLVPDINATLIDDPRTLPQCDPCQGPARYCW